MSQCPTEAPVDPKTTKPITMKDIEELLSGQIPHGELEISVKPVYPFPANPKAPVQYYRVNFWKRFKKDDMTVDSLKIALSHFVCIKNRENVLSLIENLKD